MSVPARVRRQDGTEILTCLFEGAVLQKPGKEEVALSQCLHGGLIAQGLVLNRQESCALGLYQNGGDIKKGAGLIQTGLEIQSTHIGQKLAGHCSQGNLGQLELPVGQKAQKHVEGTLVNIQGNRKPIARSADGLPGGFCHDPVHATMPREISSLATSRYSLEVLCSGENIVMGSPATVASGNLMEREMTEWRTLPSKAS